MTLSEPLQVKYEEKKTKKDQSSNKKAAFEIMENDVTEKSVTKGITSS